MRRSGSLTGLHGPAHEEARADLMAGGAPERRLVVRDDLCGVGAEPARLLVHDLERAVPVAIDREASVADEDVPDFLAARVEAAIGGMDLEPAVRPLRRPRRRPRSGDRLDVGSTAAHGERGGEQPCACEMAHGDDLYHNGHRLTT